MSMDVYVYHGWAIFGNKSEMGRANVPLGGTQLTSDRINKQQAMDETDRLIVKIR